MKASMTMAARVVPNVPPDGAGPVRSRDERVAMPTRWIPQQQRETGRARKQAAPPPPSLTMKAVATSPVTIANTAGS
jgi:hypothetical protein